MKKVETKHVKCTVCGRTEHEQDALYCEQCGTKLNLNDEKHLLH